MKEKVLVIGSTTADIHIYMDHLPGMEEDINVRRQTVSVGGCAYNAASVLHLFKVPYLLLSPVGTGIYGDLVMSLCRESGVMPFLRSDKEQGCCYCLIDESGNRTFMALHGCEYLFDEKMLGQPDPDEYSMIYICGLEIEEKTGDVLISFVKKQGGKKIVYAPGSRIRHIERMRNLQMFRLAGLIHMNRKEMKQFLESENISVSDEKEAVHQLRRYTSADLIITDGENPVIIAESGRITEIPVIPIRQVNSAGAGDAHIGTVMAMLMKGNSLVRAVKAANEISAAAVSSDSAAVTEEEFRKAFERIRMMI